MFQDLEKLSLGRLKTGSYESITTEKPSTILRASEYITKVMLFDAVKLYKPLSTLKEYDYDSYRHSFRVAYIAGAFSMWLGFSQTFTYEMILIGLLHDVGKALLPDGLTLKKGIFTPAERVLMQAHPTLSITALKQDVPELPDELIKGILYHHERYDGNGYQYGLSGREIPLNAQLLHIVDVFEALTSKRTYKKKINTKKALATMQKDIGSFNPTYINLFVEFIDLIDGRI